MIKMISAALIIVGLGFSIGAQAQDDFQRGLVEMSGGFYFMSEKCGGYTPQELAQGKREQKANAADLGIGGAEFDQLFSKGYQNSLGKWNQTAAEQQEKTCQNLQMLKNM